MENKVVDDFSEFTNKLKTKGKVCRKCNYIEECGGVLEDILIYMDGMSLVIKEFNMKLLLKGGYRNRKGQRFL